MLTKREIRETLQRLEHLRPPVVSAYVSANPAEPDHGARGLQVRLKSTLDGLGIDRGFADRILRDIASARPRAPVLAVFAREEPFSVERLEVDLGVSVEDPITGRGSARWGRPYAAPLIASLDDNEHAAAVYVDRDRFRLFHATATSIEEVDSGQRAPSPAELDRLETSKNVQPGYVPDRGGAARDDADAHLDHLQRQFYREVASRLARLLADRELGRVILLGPEENVARFEEVLDAEDAAKVAMRLSSLPDPDASPGEIKQRLCPAIEKLRDARERALIDDIAESGVTGVEECLRAWQGNQLRAIVLPWHREGRLAVPTPHVYRAAASGYLSVSKGEAEAYAAGGQAEKLAFEDALLGLVTAYDTDLDVVRGENAERLVQLGGIGGLRRF